MAGEFVLLSDYLARCHQSAYGIRGSKPMSRRLVNVFVTSEAIQHILFPMFPGVWWHTDTGLPHGAKCIGQGYDFLRDRFWFTFEHESFPHVEEGTEIPEFRPISMSTFRFESPMSETSRAGMDYINAQQAANKATELQQCATFSNATLKKIAPAPKDMNYKQDRDKPDDDDAAGPVVVGPPAK